MCTVSWLHRPQGLLLLCNRDEKKTRSAAAPPRVDVRDGVRFLAPRDGDYGGTWIAVNEYGLALALLNGGNPKTAAERSRGLLLLDWISSPDAEEFTRRFTQTDLSPYAPFTAAALMPDAKAAVHRWDGAKKSSVENGEGCMPLTSSSVDAAAAQVHRRMEFRRLLAQTGRLDGHLLALFHGSHGTGPAASALTTCMHRADAETVSFTRVTVDTRTVQLFYSPSAPCRRAAGLQMELERR